MGANIGRVAALRRELAREEQVLREEARSTAPRLAELEQITWRSARDKCLQLEKIRRDARCRLEQLSAGMPERFSGERELAEMALRDVERWELADSAAYTVISFAQRRDRLRFMIGGLERKAVISEVIQRGGVYDERGHFMEILR